MAASLRQRLLADIAELQARPYPNVALHVDERDIRMACLVLNADSYGPMHLSVKFPSDYPLSPPTIQMDSRIEHPNIMGSYICASILNTEEGYTSAYTLKSIAIQLLSFFSSESIEQQGGHYSVNLAEFRKQRAADRLGRPDGFRCGKCPFGLDNGTIATQISSTDARMDSKLVVSNPIKTGGVQTPIKSANIADEIFLIIFDFLETEDLMQFARSYKKFGQLITKYDVIRTRELQCFCLKKDYKEVKLGVGVNVVGSGKFPTYESEFDFLSQEGYKTHGIRRSTQGRIFTSWLPLPISYRHWRKVQGDVNVALTSLAEDGNLASRDPVEVLYHLMNSIVVKLNQTAENISRASVYSYREVAKSTLTHASEKAVESYFHLFHLLLCLATSKNSIVQEANKTIQNFINGKKSKEDCPNLGHLLVAALISDIKLNEENIKSIIREAITRNVLWMLDYAKGAKMPELAYMETSSTSRYRIQKTFEASKTSYRLLMFLNLFRTVALGNTNEHGNYKTLSQLRDEAFERHGAPPRGTAKMLAESIKEIHRVDNFKDFLGKMSIPPTGMPTEASFTQLLRQCVRDSMERGYSRWAITQPEALYLRRMKEPDIKGGMSDFMDEELVSKRSFFPSKPQGGVGRGGRGGYGSRGRGRR